MKYDKKIKFVLVGLWNTFFGYLIFCILDTVLEKIFITRYFAYMSAMILGQFISTINAFIFHKYVTFDSELRGKDIIPEFFRFCLTYIVTFSLSLILLPIFVEIVHFHPRISGALVMLVCTIISYVGHSRYSFVTNK